MSISEEKDDLVKVKFTSSCTDTFLIYKYDLLEKNYLNKTYELDDISLLIKGKYRITTITNGNTDDFSYDFNTIKDNFFQIKPNETYEIMIPLTVFLEKHKIRGKGLKNFYLIKDLYQTKSVQFRLIYNARVINDNIINARNYNFYENVLTSNYIKIVLK